MAVDGGCRETADGKIWAASGVRGMTGVEWRAGYGDRGMTGMLWLENKQWRTT